MRRVGLVGFGSIAENGHLPAWHSFPDVEVAAVADLSTHRLERARELLPGAALYESPIDLIARADVDIVDICAPPSTHVDLIEAACVRGLGDIVCEKPLVLSEDEYSRVARAKESSGSRVISVNNWMHSDLNRHVTRALSDGAIGDVESIELRIGRPDCALGNTGWMPRWRTDLSHSGGGIILDHGWHQVYLLLGWMGAPLQSVSAITRTVDSRHYPVEDEAIIDLHFPQGRGHIELSWAADGRTNEGTIRGAHGVIETHDDCIVVDNDRGTREVPFESKTSQSSYHPDWFQSVFQCNILVNSRDEADRNFTEAGFLVSAIQAAYRSARKQGMRCQLTPTTPAVALAGGADTNNGRSSGGQTTH